MRAKDVLYIPAVNPDRWARQFNALLCSVFNYPLPWDNSTLMWHEARVRYYRDFSSILEYAQKNHPEAVFFGHLGSDLIPEFAMYAPTRYWGFLHSLHSLEARKDFRIPNLAEWEEGAMRMPERVFTSSHAFANRVSIDPEVIGLPLYGPPGEPRMRGRILWSHRLVTAKRPLNLLGLSDKMKSRLTATTLFTEDEIIYEVLRRELPDFRTGVSDADYAALLSVTGYSLSTSDLDNFGYSVLESVWSGMFALAPNRPYLGFVEYLPPEMLYDEIGEVEEKVEYFDAHPDERKFLVLKAQTNLAHLRSEAWVRNLLNKLELVR